MQAIGYDFDYDEYHRYVSCSTWLNLKYGVFCSLL